jgi:hypothetical protein
LDDKINNMTAVEYLKQQYIERGETLPSGIFQEALEMERVQIVEAHNRGIWPDTLVAYDDGEEYYAETYNNKNKG